jgi:hypothetical protein
MKLHVLIIGALGLMSSATATAAVQQDSSFLYISRKDSSNVYLLNYVSPKPGNLVVTIKDDLGSTLVTRSLASTREFSLPVNFSSVSEGVYSVQVENSGEKSVRSIAYNHDTAPTYSHVIGIGNSRYLLEASHAGTENISVIIYDGEGNIVYEQKKVLRGNFTFLFNLKNVPGEPSFRVFEESGHSPMVVKKQNK